MTPGRVKRIEVISVGGANKQVWAGSTQTTNKISQINSIRRYRAYVKPEVVTGNLLLILAIL